MAAPTRPAEPTRGFSLQQTMLRVREPTAAVAFFTTHFGMTLIDVKRFPAMQFDLYFLASMPDGAPIPEPGSAAANAHLWTFDRATLELTHNYGTESDASFAGYSSGNAEPHRGFGHVGFIVDDIVGFCARLEAAGVRFQKRLADGRMKTIAFALSEPDGYWVEVLPRTPAALEHQLPPQPAAWPLLRGKPSLQQTMLRVRDPAASVPFYTRHLGCTLVCERHFADFSLYFLGTLPAGTAVPADATSADAWDWLCASSGAFLELTHNHGTEREGFAGYHSGNTEPRGFGHIGFLVPDLAAACAQLEAAGVAFTKRPHEGAMRGIAFARDPDGYAVELIQHGLEM
jgi:lactoylglutathione lyase